MVIGTASRCTMGHLQPVGIVHPPCRGWTWLHCHQGNGRGRTALEQETREREIPAVLTEVKSDYLQIIELMSDEVIYDVLFFGAVF